MSKWTVARSQVGRFFRLAVTAFVASGIVPQIIGGGTSRTLVIGTAVAAVEVAYRAMFPVVPKGVVDAQVHHGIMAHLGALVQGALSVSAASLGVSNPDASVEGAGFAGASRGVGDVPLPADPPTLLAAPAAPASTPVLAGPPPTDVTSVVSEPVPSPESSTPPSPPAAPVDGGSVVDISPSGGSGPSATV